MLALIAPRIPPPPGFRFHLPHHRSTPRRMSTASVLLRSAMEESIAEVKKIPALSPHRRGSGAVTIPIRSIPAARHASITSTTRAYARPRSAASITVLSGRSA